MELVFISFLAGILTILAPCAFTLLPITLGGTSVSISFWKPFRIIISLCFSIFIFTLLLRTTASFIPVSNNFWQIFSGILIIIYGVSTLLPSLWEKIENKLTLSHKSGELLSKANKIEDNTLLKDIALGVSLGPIFTSCSPTYFFIVGTVIAESYFIGLINLFAYVAGLASILTLIAFFGFKIIDKLKWASDPNGIFKKIIGVIFISLGIIIIFGLHKQIETKLIDAGLVPLQNIETELIENINK